MNEGMRSFSMADIEPLLAELRTRIVALERRVWELESKPRSSPIVVGGTGP